ncbi:MAG TPA: type II toxin-antitoxin system Phd/YefM family antitoxin [Planctomycetota bacterium]|nr:type II toxin-antitoxin system Phd/YefM family antitoxin [Planctomycetota bacterium]
MKTINASDFKARCLKILDEVGRTGETVTILKRGHPVAQLIAVVEPDGSRHPQDSLAGTVTIVGDIVEPVVAAGDWEAETTPSPR